MAMAFRKKGLFGRDFDPMNPPNSTAPIVGGDQPGLGMMREEKPKGGFFRMGGPGRAIAGTLGDFLLQQSDMAPVYAPAMQQQAAFAAQEAEAQRKRSQELADWKYKEDYKRDNAGPQAPNLREDNAGNVWQFDPRTGMPMGDKPVWVDPTEKIIYQDGMQIRVPNPYRSGGATGGIAPGTIDGNYRFKGGDPSQESNWEPVNGGPTQPASGGFRR